MGGAGAGAGYMRGLEEEEGVTVKEEEAAHNPRSFALFDSPTKFRFASKSPQFYDKHVSDRMPVTKDREDFKTTEKAPTRACSWLKAPSNALTSSRTFV